MVRTRQYVLAGLFLVLAAIATFVLAAVVETIIIAITVAYVLYPLRQWLYRRGLSARISSALATATAGVAVVAIFTPFVYVLYRRRDEFIEALEGVPAEISVVVGGNEFVAETGPVVDTIEGVVVDLAVGLAVAAPRIALELTLFVFVIYAVLYKPDAAGNAAYNLVPPAYHDVIDRLHRRTKRTLYGIYVLQAATAAGTFAVALPLFWALGYGAPTTLAALAAILQFVPVVGPSLLIGLVAANDVLVGMPGRAATVAVLGLVLVGFAPDAIIRPKLAGITGDFTPVLYFIGFIGGILTIGAVGVIIGPLVVGLIAEVAELLSERESPQQTALPDAGEGEETTDSGE